VVEALGYLAGIGLNILNGLVPLSIGMIGFDGVVVFAYFSTERDDLAKSFRNMMH
jgi:hypothetical protein